MQLDLSLNVNQNFSKTFLILDNNGIPIDLTVYSSINASLHSYYSDIKITDFTVNVDNIGHLTITFPLSLINLYIKGGQLYKYNITLIDQYNNVTVPFYGNVRTVLTNVDASVLTSMQFTPITSNSISTNSLFVNIVDGKLSFKDGSGVVWPLYEENN